MIIYKDTKHGERLDPPAWLEGADGLQTREDAGGRLFSIGDGRMVGPAPDKSWTDIEDGIQGRVLKPFAPGTIKRTPEWCRLFYLHDQQARLWPVPQILSADGTTLAIQVTYGAGWQAQLTPLQHQAEKAARWARQTIATAVETGCPIIVSDACQAAAELLASVLHVSPQALAALQLLDQPFILAVLRTAAGWIPGGDDD